ncbi:hypothetical protein [Roseibium sp.]|uniref:hypothetical protein n=1 Tax=Roseibium sp. TaxID=1936156 RepID=UPI003B51BA7E
MIREIRNWFFNRWVRFHLPAETETYILMADVEQEHMRHFYVGKTMLRLCFPRVDLIEIADGVLTIVKGDCTARIEV